MSAAGLVSDLQARGVLLEAQGGRLRVNAPKGVMTPALRRRLAAHKEEILALLAPGPPGAPRLERIPREGRLPLSFAQERLWFLDRLGMGGVPYNIPLALRVSGPLDATVLERCLAFITERHEVFRASCREDRGRPFLTVVPRVVVPLQVLDLSRGGAAEPASLLRETARIRFDLGTAPILRALLLRLAEREHIFLLVTHHFIADGWSMRIVVQDLAASYLSLSRGDPPDLSDLPIQYVDFSAWQRRDLAGERLERELDYWLQMLSGMPPALDLPFARARPGTRSARGAVADVHLGAELSESLRAISRRYGCTLFMTLTAGFLALLARYTGRSDVAVATAVSSRPRSELEPLIGCFINNLVLRCDLSGRPDFAEALMRVREVAVGAFAHQSLPFEKLVKELQPRRDLGRTPLFQAMLVLENAPLATVDLGGLRLEPIPVDLGTSRFDLTLSLTEGAGGLAGRLEYDPDIFAAEDARRLLGHYRTLLAGAVEAPGRRITELPLLTSEERRAVVEEWNATSRTFGPPRSLIDLFETQVASTPQMPAVSFQGAVLTYEELDRRSTAVAHRLSERGVGPETVVGVAMDRSLEMVVALLGALKAGAAYLPLDPAYPRERLAMMVEDSGARCLLVRRDGAGNLPVTGETPVLIVDRDGAPDAPAGRPAMRVDPGTCAYVIYTSGSTGRPKGVMVTHHAIVNRLLWMQEQFRIGPADRVAQKTPITFDVSVWELFWPLTAGAMLEVAPPGIHRDPRALSAWIAATRVNVIHFVPSMLRVFLEHGELDSCRSLRLVMASGETLTRDLADRFHRQLAAELHNLYGPTEAAVDVTHWHCRPEESDGAVPIGRPIANLRLLVLDEALHPAPIGVPGELFIGGAGLARGYLGRPDLTAERFVPDALGGCRGGRLYRTGDLARWRSDGAIEFLGRRDQQIKLRGFRIELGEIESVLGHHPKVAQAAVAVRESRTGDRHLAAFVVRAGDSRPTAAELREHLASRLPAHMVPGPIVFLDEFPLGPSGKVNRSALPPSPPPGVEGEAERLAPTTPLEQVLAGIWSDVLGLDDIPAGADFFSLGGHSLLAAQLVAGVREAFDVELPLAAVFAAPRLDAMAREIASRDRGGEVPPLTALSHRDELPLSAIQERLWFLDRFAPGSGALNIPMGLRLRGPLEEGSLRTALQRVVARHEILRVTFDERDGAPVQRSHELVEVPLPVVDLRDRSPGEAERSMREHAEEEAAAPFDLARGPVLRGRLLRLDKAEHVLLLTVHHIAADGWSAGLLVQDLAEVYGGLLDHERPPPPPPPFRYADFAAWQALRLQSESLGEKLRYWEKALAGAPAQIEVPLDRPRLAIQTYRGDRAGRCIGVEPTRLLKELAREEGSTTFMALLALFGALLRRWCGQEEVVIGTPVAGRPHRQLERVIGPFLNTVALRIGAGHGPSFRERLRQARDTVLGALQNAEVPFERVLEALQPPRDTSRTPLFQVFFNMLNFPVQRPSPAALEIEPLAPPPPPAKFDLALYSSEERGEVRLDLVYNADLFERPRVEELLDELVLLLDQTIADPERPLDAHSLVTARARGRLPDPSARLDDSWPGPVHEIVAREAARNPEARAIVDARGSWTYRELTSAASAIARVLRERGVERGDVVAVYAHRSAALVWAILGSLQAGAAVTLLDPAYPARRLRQYLDLVEPAALLRLVAAGPLPALLEEDRAGPSGYPVIDVPPDPVAGRANAVSAREQPPAPPPRADDLAFVSFTSGSTGGPKAVASAHRSLSHFLAWQQSEFALSSEDRYSMLSGLSHDPLQREIFTSLCTGATLCIPDPARMETPGWLAEWAGREGITVAHLTPSMARLLGEVPEGREHPAPALRLALFVGEALTRSTVQRLRRFAAGVRCVNLYGATETQRAVGWRPVESAEGDGPLKEVLPLGRGIPDVQLLIRGKEGTFAGVGELGEILVRSPHIARGYLGRPESTEERFRPNPFGADPSDRVYVTGDLGRYLPDGNVEWGGRADRQIKLRGFRIEPEEIEAALESHPSVEAAAVVLREDLPPGPQLLAYIKRRGDVRPEPAALRSFLAERLPAHMVPARFTEVASIPLTPNGKVDYSVLPDPQPGSAGAEGESARPRDGVEARLARIWEETLGRRPVGVRDDFFSLGGHSLLAVRLLSRVESEFGRRLPLASLFQQPTIEQLAVRLREGRGPDRSPLVSIQAGGRRPPLLCVHPVGGTVLCYQQLARELGEGQPFHGLEAPGVDGERPPLRRVEEMAACYLSAVRQAGIAAPYLLAGWSFGGLVAFEMARVLREAGEPVGLLALLDTQPPGAAGDQDEAGDEAAILRLMARALGDLSGRPIDLAASELNRLPDREARLAFVVDRAHRSGALPPDVGVERARPLIGVVEANLAARRHYTPPAYGGKILLLRASVTVPATTGDPALGWGRLASAVEVEMVPGDHYTMLARPNVQHVARRLAERLPLAAARRAG